MSEYQKFIYNNQSVIIKPGQDFSSNELKLRLKTMGMDANSFQNKSSLIKLYDISIKTDENKIKIINKLMHDTEVNDYNKPKKTDRIIDSMPIYNIQSNKEMNLNNAQYNHNHSKVQLKRANKITEESINKYGINPLLVNSEDIEQDESKPEKILKQILCHSISGFIIISSAMGLLYIYRIYSEEINKEISRIVGFLSNYDIYWFVLAFILMFVFLLVLTKSVDKFIKNMGNNKK
jgi:hypothetical protein